MTEAEDLRSDALAHAIAAYGELPEGENLAASTKHVISLAVVFAAYIEEGATEALRILENRPEPGEVVRLVPATAPPEPATAAPAPMASTALYGATTGVQGTQAEERGRDIG